MMTETEYLYAWLYYLLGAGLLISCWWYATRRIPWPEVRHLSRLVVGVAIVVPWYTNTQQDYLSPALLISLLELFFEGASAFWRAGAPMLAAVAVAVAFSTLFFVVRWYLHQRKMAPTR
ncbi:hypothetical protein [Teredinibacter purpureus]|uniref:hypothetical protein n=1 Tax=Teredinibacter purpureus TaxID=2731756 RepID=UPI0005F8906F|nr:hypothetical protein [Teredinibacter purpureus]